jgi:hypothetical protein
MAVSVSSSPCVSKIRRDNATITALVVLDGQPICCQRENHPPNTISTIGNRVFISEIRPLNVLPEGSILHRRLRHDGYNCGSRRIFTPGAVTHVQ